MCGIHGILDKSLSPAVMQLSLQEMAAAQRHRGPDDRAETIYQNSDYGVGLGFVRLSILDLETGMQPITSLRSGSSIVCNGQIYNYRELKRGLASNVFTTKGDIEVALHLYDQMGIEFLHHLNGMYAGAIYDPHRRRLVLFTDRFGIKPLYYAHVDGRFCFASEIKALRKALPLASGVNNNLLPLYLSYGYTPGENTLVEHVKRLQPGSFLIFDFNTDKVTTSTYWSYQPVPDNAITVEDAADQFTELLDDAVALRLQADVPVGSLLSGGIDSCAVATLATRSHPDLAFYSVAFEQEAFDESAKVSEFARSWLTGNAAANVSFTCCNRDSLADLPAIIYHLDEPTAKTSLLPTWQLFKMVGEQHKAVLSGEGADELFAGYGWFWIDPGQRHGVPGQSPEELYLGCRSFFSNEEIGRLLQIDPPEVRLPEEVLAGLALESGPLETTLQLESRCRLPTCNLMRVDKLAMAHSVEARTPFLDYRIAEFAMTLPADLKLGSTPIEQKYVCREAFDRHGILPAWINRARKQPFCAPIDDWLRDPAEMPEFLQSIAAFKHPLFTDCIDPVQAQKMTEGFLLDTTTPFTNVTATDRFWSLCVLAVWYEQNLNGQTSF